MVKMKLYNLGKVPWYESQLIYHALAKLGQEALVLLSPSTPYVCIGFHQNPAQELDLEYCKANAIPVFRREVGGGAVYLDGDQLFFQLILRKDNPIVPKKRGVFYKKFLSPVINVYRRIGIHAEYRPINDVVVKKRKISGTGVGEIGDCIVFVGNVIRDFDYEMMERVLRVPDEKFRDKIKKSLIDNLTTIRHELGEKRAKQCDEKRLSQMLVEEFQKIIGPTEDMAMDDLLQNMVNDLKRIMLNDTWLHQKGKRKLGTEVKIRSGVKVLHRTHKAAGGLMRGDFEIRDGRFVNVSLSGDFFCFPSNGINRLEEMLEGCKTDMARRVIKEFYCKDDIETLGIGVEDWMHIFEVN
ncbi:MAG: lipoate--protein ligase family protein [Deltaproteobacteria bacterium]|nr:lipoate--protein ligase family protein [Deltaproteobacteria bacterium]MBW1931317.1 lipoate--protein ligase family protein [Deltaproteobacteria bacterium]MBW2026886.1 lipoate--protein ligase family protein [Deltaproteobacteria bacterium]MBW2126912.1 lipoate--protein ligase family protein [Deltaproteobacteria bacterium]